MYLDSDQGKAWSPHDKGIIVRRTDSNGENDLNTNSQNNMNTSDQSMDAKEQISKHQMNAKWYAQIRGMFCCRSGQIQDQHEEKLSPYALYLNEDLSPRSSSWVYLASSSLAGLATVLVIEQPILNENERNGPDSLLISILSTSFVLSSIIAISYRHRMLRNFLTKDMLACTSFECLLSFVLFILWCVELRYVMDPFSGVEYGLTLTNEKWGQHYYEVVWNDNLWFISWLGGGIISCLVGELVVSSSEKRRGTVESSNWRNVRLDDSGKHTDGDEYMRTYNLGDGSTQWFLMLVSSCALSAFCIDYRMGVSCEGTLGSTPFCKRCVLGFTTGILCAMISVGALSLHFVNLRTKNDTSGQIISHQKLWSLEANFATVSFILNSINVGFITSPRGPGAEIGNIFVTAWLGLIISFFSCLQLEKGLILRVITHEEAERANDGYVNQMTNERDAETEHYSKEKHPQKQQRGNMNIVKSDRKHVHTEKKQRKQAYARRYNDNGDEKIHSPDPRRVFISKATRQKSSSSSDSSDSSSSSSSSVSLTEIPPNDQGVQRMDTDGERTSGATSAYSLPLPPPICLDSSSDDHGISQPSLSPTLNSINGGQATPHALQKTIKSSPTPPLPPYNAYGFSNTLDNPNINSNDDFSSEEDDDNSAAIEICADHPDDVSSLGVSMLSLGQSGHSAADPDGYKSEDNYVVPPLAKKSNRNSYDRRPSRVKRLMSDDLPTVEEQSLSTSSKIDSTSADDTAEQVMNLGRKLEDGPISRLDSGNGSSVGPMTVDESVSHTHE